MENKENNKVTYYKEGDYLIQNLKLPEENPKYKNKTIGKYGRLRLNYLKENKKGLYEQLIIENKLFEHLVDTNEEAKKQVKLIINQIAEQEHINEYQKRRDALDWVCAMNNAQARAIEYKKLSEKLHKIMDKYTNLQLLLEDEKIVELNTEECKQLQEVLSLDMQLRNFEERQIFFLGARENYFYLQNLGLIKR